MSIVIPGFNDKPIGGWSNNKGDMATSTTTTGGFTQNQKDLEEDLYNLWKTLPENMPEYVGKKWSDFTDNEKAILSQLQQGGGYKSLYDTAGTNLGLAQNATKSVMDYGASDLTRDANQLMNPYQRDVVEATKRQMQELSGGLATQTGASAYGAGAGGGSRHALANVANNLGLVNQFGQIAGNLNMQGYRDAMSNARGLQNLKLTGANQYANLVNQQLGIGKGGLDTDYQTKLGAEGQIRGMKDRELGDRYKTWQQKQMFPWMKTKFGSQLYSGMPIMPETTTTTSQPERSGK